ncbi:hypothetical protein LMG7974_01822 [Campylobacter majalis]|uniref:Uncharacterized protein n=1 Tax=Campylobacter majalis TaxID=2790656 RepID=A0ABM8QA51_9BACT|nr:hypothetical protein LMG7974_01822 [Campylobacter majalis]
MIWAPIVAIAGLSSYLNAPDVNEQPKNGVVIDNPTLLAVGGGVTANIATKELSSLILSQTAQASVKAGLIGGGVDAGMQIGGQAYDKAIDGVEFKNVLDASKQILDNANSIKFSDFSINPYSILYSSIATATTIPTATRSIKSIMYSSNAKKELKRQLETTTSKVRQEKINQSINKHNRNMMDNFIFQGTSIGIKVIIKDNIVYEGNANE